MRPKGGRRVGLEMARFGMTGGGGGHLGARVRLKGAKADPSRAFVMSCGTARSGRFSGLRLGAVRDDRRWREGSVAEILSARSEKQKQEPASEGRRYKIRRNL
jgi:hypothetical protein